MSTTDPTTQLGSDFADRTSPARKSGPLVGLRVIELAGIGPGPHAAMPQ